MAVGIVAVSGDFDAGAAVEVAVNDGDTFAKGLVRYDSETIRAAAGLRSADSASPASEEVINRDELVVLP